MTETDVNWELLGHLAVTPHPLLNPQVCDCHHWCGEINQEAKVSHHLLDLAGIPHGKGYRQNLDARTYQAVMRVTELQIQIGRIAAWHRRVTGPSRTVDDSCRECNQSWPCDTRRMADGTYEDPA